MPLWQIHHHPDAFSKEQKLELSKRITDRYYTAAGLPKFYVIVIFSPNEDIYIGGEPEKNFVRIVISHLAREANHDIAAARRIQRGFDAILKPFIEDRGMTWEYNYDHSPRLWWKINGKVPPTEGSDMEKLWRQENKSVPYDDSKM